MLLPKRVKRRMKKHLSDEEINKTILEGYVEMQNALDKFILDDENAIIIITNDDKSLNSDYTMIHKRLVDGKLKEINRWSIDGYYFYLLHDLTLVKNSTIFKIQNGQGYFNAAYDYKNDRFVVPRGEWDLIEFGCENKSFEQYNGILALFSLASDYEDDDTVSYENLVTGEKIVESFVVSDGNYYAFLNLDGTIRGNKLFKGSDFSKIEEIIDLDEYGSLEEFKKIRIQLCNEKKREQKQEYYSMIASRNNGSISPYLDSEVARILKLK